MLLLLGCFGCALFCVSESSTAISHNIGLQELYLLETVSKISLDIA